MELRKKLTPEILIELHVGQKKSLTKIGEIFGVSRQRVFQLKKEYEKEHGKISRQTFVDIITLKKYVEKRWSAKKIADELNIHPSKVNRLIREYETNFNNGETSIKIKRKTSKDVLPPKVLYKLYKEDLYTDKEIGKMYNLSPSSVSLLRSEYGINAIKTKALRKLPKLLTKEKFTYLYTREQLTLQEISDRFNCNIVSLIQLKNYYGIVKPKKK